LASSESSPQNLTLKRNVVIKAIVTEKFKKFLIHDMNQAMTFTKQRIEQINNYSKTATGDQKKQADLENQKQQGQLQNIQQRLDQAKDLKLKSEFMQGTIEGLTTIKAGDNLYQKLGGVEVLVKDGVVQSIRHSKQQDIFSSSPG